MGQIAGLVQQRQSMVIEPSKIEAVPITDDSGTTVMLRPQDVGLFISGQGSVSNAEVAAFFIRCATWQVNPYKNEAYLIKYGNQPASIVIAEKVFEQRADKQPDYDGMEYGVIYMDKNGEEHKRQGKRINKGLGENLVGAYAKVFRKGRRDSYTEISLDEYAQTHRDKSGRTVLNSKWATQPATMLVKCVKAAALRDAYPNAFSGMYTESELDTARPVESTSEPVVEQPEARISKAVAEKAEERHEVEPEQQAPEQPVVEHVEGPVSSEQQNRIISMVRVISEATEKSQADLMNALLKSKAVAEAGYDGTNDLNAYQANVCIEVLRHWAAKAGVDPKTGEVKAD